MLYRPVLETADPAHILRATHPDDAPALHALANDPANNAFLARYERWAQGFTQEEAQVQTARVSGHMLLGGTTLMQYLAWHQGPEDAAERLTGCHTLYDRLGASAFMGYWQVPASCGKGLATLGAQRLLAYAQEVWDLNEVILRIADDNERSQAMARRLGAQRTGTIMTVEERGHTDLMRVWKIFLP